MQHRPVRDRQRQVLAPAAAHEVAEADTKDAARLIDPRAVFDTEIVPLAGDDHVVVAVIAHLGGPPRQMRHQPAGHGQRIALAFLATEPAAHAAAFDPDRVHRKPKRLGHLVLDLGRVLGGGLHHHAPLGGKREGGLTLQIEMLLPAHVEAPFDHMRRGGDGGPGIALLPDHRPAFETAVGLKRLIDGQDRGPFAVVDPAQPGGLARLKMAFRDDEEDRLADVMHHPRGQHRFIMDGRGHIVGEGQVPGGPDRDHARRGAHRRQVHRRDFPMRDGRQAEGKVQGVRGQRHVVDIARPARNVQRAGIMRQGLCDAHGVTSRTDTACPARSWK